MLGEITAKARDAGAMFVSALTDEERRWLFAVGVYACSTLFALYRDATRKRERDRLRSEIIEELTHGR